MSNLLKEKYSLTKLREELEERKGKLCRCCEKFRHLAHNYKNKEEEEKGIVVPQNRFEVLKSRVMQCGVKEKTIRKVGVMEVKYYKCGEIGHKCRECLVWERKERVACVAKLQNAHQQRELVCPVKEKAQEEERRLRRVEEEEAMCVVKPQEA